MPRAKPIPEFATEAEERRFWETHDSRDYVDWSAAQFVKFANLKPSTETISLRLPAGLLADLKALANRQDVPYQSLLKVFLAERVSREWRLTRASVPANDRRRVVRQRKKVGTRSRSART
jgi:predicted DNA binding CopG/RHH family protein